MYDIFWYYSVGYDIISQAYQTQMGEAKTESKYRNGKIYMLQRNGDENFYIGSTIHKLATRFSKHVKHSASPKRKCPVHRHFGRGLVDVDITLIENYPCATKEELLQREQLWIDKLKPTLNKHPAFVPVQPKETKEPSETRQAQYLRAHKAEQAAAKKLHMAVIHADPEKSKAFLEKRRAWCAKNKDKIRAINKRHAAKRVSTQCPCGSTVKRIDTHMLSKGHQAWAEAEAARVQTEGLALALDKYDDSE